MKATSPALLTVLAVVLAVTPFATSLYAADAPKDRVVAMYFHRTQRCPTCKKMGSYAEEAIKTAFAEQLKNKTVAFHFIDFQDPKNAAYAKGYKITGPALVVAKIENSKVKEYSNLGDIWEHVADKAAFMDYVQKNVTKYLK